MSGSGKGIVRKNNALTANGTPMHGPQANEKHSPVLKTWREIKMGIDVTFQPKTPTYAVDSSAAVVIDGRQLGVTSWRIRLVLATPTVGATGYIKWANGNAAAPSAAAAPALVAPVQNELGVNLGQTLYIEGVGAWLQFIGNAPYATSYFEVTGGQGGAGG
jgi:hypothetical protein